MTTNYCIKCGWLKQVNATGLCGSCRKLISELNATTREIIFGQIEKEMSRQEDIRRNRMALWMAVFGVVSFVVIYGIIFLWVMLHG